MSGAAASHPHAPTTVSLGGDRGLSVQLLPARGLDIGAVSFDGGLISWSPGAGVPESPAPEGPDRWLSSFGGLVATCGLNNVGAPSDGYGLHGAFTLTAAEDVTVVHDDGIAVVTGTITDEDLVCRRMITVTDSTLTISDDVTNTADAERQSPILYHVNFGTPVLGPELVVDGRVDSSTSRDPRPDAPVDWRRPARNGILEDVVIEHRLTAEAPREITLTEPKRGLRVRVGWTGLDRVHQWIDLTPRWFVVAIEPANCSVQGREFDRAADRAPFLGAGESRRTTLTIICERLPGDPGA